MAAKCPACGHEFGQPTQPVVVNSLVLAICRDAIDMDPDNETAREILAIIDPKRKSGPGGCSGCRGL